MALRTKTMLMLAAALVGLTAVVYALTAVALMRGTNGLVLLAGLGAAGLVCFLVLSRALDRILLKPLAEMNRKLEPAPSGGELPGQDDAAYSAVADTAAAEAIPGEREPAAAGEIVAGKAASATSDETQPAPLNPPEPPLVVMEETAPQPEAGRAQVQAQAVQEVLAELRALNAVSQAISIQTGLDALCQVIYEAVIQFMGEVDFLVALYDPEQGQIQIPAMWEKNQLLSVPPYPLGAGLVSILLRTRQPLMINEDAEQRAAALGALVLGKPARSWLGVPMIVGGDVIGALVVQDVEREKRFAEDDQRLLSTLAAQVGAAIRNVQILEKARQQARRERALHEMTSKIRSTVEMRTIMTTATTELGKALNLRRVQIRLGSEPPARAAEEAQVQAAVPPASVIGRRAGGEKSPEIGKGSEEK